MTDRIKVLVLDDDPTVAQGWVDQIQESLGDHSVYSVDAPSDAKKIENSVHEIIKRQIDARQPAQRDKEYSLFDEYDVLIVDYDLVHIDDFTGRYTGEGIGRIVRCFSNCSFIIVMNQFSETDFDLTQRGNASSHADLNINSSLLTNPALWREADKTDIFRPWHWAPISDELLRIKHCASRLSQAGLDAPILPLLGFDESLASFLSDEAVGFVAPTAETLEAALETSSRSFLLENSAAADRKDAAALIEIESERWATIVASRLTKWLDRMVANRRDLLVDVPHLMERFPFLVPEDKRSSLSEWNSLTLQNLPDWTKACLPETTWLAESRWLLRPAVWLPRLLENELFQDQLSSYDFSDAPNFAFQEDASKFANQDDCTPFRAQLNTPFDRRYLRYFDDIKYAPRRRLAL